MKKAILAFLNEYSDIEVNDIDQLSTIEGPYIHKKDFIEDDSYIFDEINGSLKQEIISYTYRTYIDHKIKVLILLDPTRKYNEEESKDIAMCYIVSHHSMCQYYQSELEAIYFFHIYADALENLETISCNNAVCEIANKTSIPIYVKQLA